MATTPPESKGLPINIVVCQPPARTRTVVGQLEGLWEDSVRATHDFLTEQNIQSIKPLVRHGLENILVLCVARDNQDNILGFMGVEENKIEMLFVYPEAQGRGVGRQLIAYAIQSLNSTLVDVNEQNTQAVGFYLRMGFAVFKRSPVDGQGNAFPLLHMELEKK